MTKKELLKNLKRRILENIATRPTGCWDYQGRRDKCGYGRIKIAGSLLRHGRPETLLVHRIIYRLLVGKIKKGMCVCHRCNNPSCCNPKHLYQGTAQDNANDKIKAGNVFVTWGPKSGNCKLNTRQVNYIRASTDRCIDLAEKFGVTKSTISEIRNHKSRCYE